MLSSLFYKQCPKRRLDNPSPIAESANLRERQDNSSGEIKSWINLDESDHKITANASLEVLVPQSRYVTIELVKGVNVELGDISNTPNVKAKPLEMESAVLVRIFRVCCQDDIIVPKVQLDVIQSFFCDLGSCTNKDGPLC